MSFSAMDLGWKRIHRLFIILIYLKYAYGHRGCVSRSVQLQQNWPVQNLFSPRGVQSSVLEAPASGSIPVEEVASNVFAKKRSQFSLSSQSVKGGFSSTYEPMSQTQSASSGSDSVSSLLRPQGSSSSNAQSVVGQSAGGQGSSSLSMLSSQDRSGLQGVSAPLSFTPVQGGSSSGLSILSQSSPSLSTPDSSSKLSLSPLAVSALPTSDPSSSSMSTAGSQRNTGFQLAGPSSSFSAQSSSSTGPSRSSSRLLISQGSSGPQLAGSYSQLVSTSGLLTQSPSSGSQTVPGSSYAKLAASPLGFSQSTSGQSSYSQYTSSSQSRVGPQVGASSQYLTGQGSSYGSSVQPQGTTSQYAPSRFSSLSSAGGSMYSSVQSQGTSSQTAPAPSSGKVPVYSQVAPSGSSLSMSPPQWQSSVSRSQTIQTSGAVASPSQGFKAPSGFSTSAGSPGQSGRYSGLSVQSQSASSQYSPGSSASGKFAASPLGASLSPIGQVSSGLYASSSQSRAGTQLSGTSPFAPMQTGSVFTGGSPLQLQGTSTQYAPASLDSKVPVYSQAASSGSLSLSQPSQWQPSSLWSQGLQTSGTVALQSSSPSQGFKAPSRFSTLSSAASPSQFASTPQGSGRYSGLSMQSLSTSSQYSPGSSGYSKLAASPLGVSQYTGGQGSSGQYTSCSQSTTGALLSGSNQYAPMQPGGTSTDGSSLQLQGPSLSSSQPSQWQASSRWSQGFQTSGTVALQSGSPSQGSKTPSRFSTLGSAASPGQFASTQGSGRYSGLSSVSQGTSSQYSPGSLAYAKRGSSLDVSSQSTSGQSSSGLYPSSSQSMAGTSNYVPVQTGGTFTGGSSFQSQGTSNQYAPSVSSPYTQASPSGSFSSGSAASLKWQSSASTLSQGFQASGAAVPSSSSSPQSSWTSSGSSFPVAMSPSVAQSSSSRRTSSFFGVGLGPSKFTAQASSGSAIGSQIPPAPSASLQQPSDSMTSSLGASSFQGASQGTFSGQSSDSTVVSSSSTYGQGASGFYRSPQRTSATGRYSSVKG